MDKTGVDIKKLKAYVVKNVGKKCKTRDLGCITCSAWRIVEDVEELLKQIKEIDAWAKKADRRIKREKEDYLPQL